MQANNLLRAGASVFLFLLALATPTVAQQVVGVSAVVAVSDASITTFSATEVDYQTAAYYEPYVEGYLYQDGSLIGSGSATANTVSNCDGSISSQVAEGCIQKPVAIGSNYQVQSDHYLIAAFAYYDGSGTPYYSNPDYFLPGDQSDGSSDTGFNSGGGDVYVSYQYLFLGTTALGAAAPSTIFSSGLLSDVISAPQDLGNGTYQVTLSSPAYTSLLDQGFIDATTLEEGLVLCPFAPVACEVVVGGVVVYYGAKLIIDSGALEYVYNVFTNRVDSPIGYPGSDPNKGPDGWTAGTDSTGKPYYTSPDGTKSTAPDLGNEKEGPHWDYNDLLSKPRNWRVWPDGKMTPK